MEAEARSLLTLFPDQDFLIGLKAIDLYLEYRCLLNHNHKYAYGEQFIEGEIIRTTPPKPKWERVESDDDLHHKPSYSLAACCFKLLGIQIDTKEKNEVRSLIIRGEKEEILDNVSRIQRYNLSDIQYMPRLLSKIFALFKQSGVGENNGALNRGSYACATARMVRLGYPVNHSKLTKFTANIPAILKSSAERCIDAAGKDLAPFRQDKKGNYILNEKHIRDWVTAQNKPYWRKTAGSKLSISKDAFADWYTAESEGFAGAFVSHLKTKQSLNGFMPGGKKGNFFDFVGTDGRVRPNFGIYGSQASRSQPGATGFLPLKAHWMRNFIEAPGGNAICGIDYSSQEFLIAAVISQDEAMMGAYESGDVYLAFAKEAKLVPTTATKQSHKSVRDKCKTLVLGISYDMTANGLAPRMGVTKEVAEKLIQKFMSIYSDYAAWKAEILEEYREHQSLALSDRWMMWGDNDNERSVGNFPIQGHGAVIMREAVKLAHMWNLDVIYTLHDAIYIEYHHLLFEYINVLKDCMQTAFKDVMCRYGRCPDIRLEGEAWSRHYTKDVRLSPIADVQYLEEYIDDKGRNDLDRYRQYFT